MKNKAEPYTKETPMSKRTLKTILYGIIVAVDLAAWAAIVFSGLCIVNGGRWKMVITLVIGAVLVWLCGELADAVDDKL